MENFFLSDTNPNDAIGGGGCLCSPSKAEDCCGPFAIFPGNETDCNLSPHVVLSLHCATKFLEKAEDALLSGDMPSAGEKDPVRTDEDVL